ncbi:MAG: NTP transferase domain-containing protein [Candidatus Aenigmarchaeota archaeon]|nr:NTP transferase domain-containing protein [Candidatus Aenigmarchaeota archaeon]
MSRDIERISLTIDKDILDKVDKVVDGTTIKNRSHAIEMLLMKSLGPKLSKAIILCGGKGTRFRPITYEIPKALIPVHGKPIISHILDLFKKYQIMEIYLSVGYLKDRVKERFGDGSKLGFSIKYVEEDEPLGTAGFLRLVSDIDSDFIVSNGDELKDINIEEMYKIHRENNALVTIALTTVSDPSAYGVAKLDGNKILDFVEKPKKGEEPSNLINAGFYIISPEVMKMIPKGFAMFEKDVFPKIAKMGRLYGYMFGGQWFDIGTPERYEIALKKWKGVSK